jgi:hypothetical protein
MKQEKLEPNLVNNTESPKEHSDWTRSEDLSHDKLAQHEEYWVLNPELPKPETKRESGPEILEVEVLIVSFELKFPVQELMAINSFDEALKNPLRIGAVETLRPILKRIETLKKETDINQVKLDELENKYRELSRAIGILNSVSRTVDHDR